MTATLADVIAPQLPYLRRFSRALCGTQARGDAYVVALLEAIVAEPSTLAKDLSPRTALYRAFAKVWNAVPINWQSDTPDAGLAGAADRRIETLTPLSRQAFLLASLEEFSTADIAVILDRSPDVVKKLIDDAGREIADQIAARVLIIEDEPLIALDIETLVSEIGHRVVGIARTRKEASALAAKTEPELVLADIQLADGSSGIDAVNDILSASEIPVIFITAHPERLLTGERAEPTYLITKPFKPEMVKAVISQVLFFDVKAKRGIHPASS